MPTTGELIHHKYRLERELGRGGMGVVFLAVHEDIGKPVAIKFLLKEYAEHEHMLGRFQQEARAASAIGHRNIIDVYDLGIAEDGSPFIVMEMLLGESLASRLKAEEPLDLETVAYVACHVLSGLSAAHAAGIVHRDLKPDNVYLVNTGAMLSSIKLLDFGISRVLTDESSGTGRMTSTGMVMGTPHYMSPEQAGGRKDVDHRTDLYSMGVILYEYLTGHLPFTGDNYNAMIVSIVSDEPANPSTWHPEIESDLEAIILRALGKTKGAGIRARPRCSTPSSLISTSAPSTASRCLAPSVTPPRSPAAPRPSASPPPAPLAGRRRRRSENSSRPRPPRSTNQPATHPLQAPRAGPLSRRPPPRCYRAARSHGRGWRPP